MGGNSGNEQRGAPRKDTLLPVAIGEKVRPQPANVIPFPQPRMQMRHRPEHQINVALLFQARAEGTIINISSTGIAVLTKTVLVTGNTIGVSFLIPDKMTNTQVPIIAKCKVVWVDKTDPGYKIGLQFILMDSPDAHLLGRYVETLPEAAS